MLVPGVLAAPVVLAALALATPPQFLPPQTVAPSGPNVGLATEIEMGDLNGDGVPDAVITRISYPLAPVSHPVGIVLGDGKGGYVDGSSMWQGPAPQTVQGRQILIADFNGDHRNDIFVADHGYDADPFPGHQNTLALSTPDGHLIDATANLPPETSYSHSAAVADVDRDGDLDLYVGNLGSGDGTPPEILLNDGTGHFTRRIDLLPPELQNTNAYRYTRALFVDVDGDGAPDLVLPADTSTAQSQILLNDGRGRFRMGPALPAKPFGSNAIGISVATLDVNRDGRPDLLVGYTRGDPFYSGSALQVLVNDGTGVFTDQTSQWLPSQPSTTGWPYAIRIADVNHDGRPDLGVDINGNENGLLYLDDGTGVFRQADFAPANRFWAFADANGDGYPDIFSTQSGSPEQHEIQLQQPPAPGAVTGLHAAHALHGVSLRWNAAPGATSYEVWRNRKKVATVTGTSFVDKHVRLRVTYAYQVRAIGPGGAAPLSAAVRIRA